MPEKDSLNPAHSGGFGGYVFDDEPVPDPQAPLNIAPPGFEFDDNAIAPAGYQFDDEGEFQVPEGFKADTHTGFWGKVLNSLHAGIGRVASSLQGVTAAMPEVGQALAVSGLGYGAANPENVKLIQETLAIPPDEWAKGAFDAAKIIEKDLPQEVLNTDFVEAFNKGDIGGLGEAAIGTMVDLAVQAMSGAATSGASMFTQGIWETYRDSVDEAVKSGAVTQEEALDDLGRKIGAVIAGSTIGALEKYSFTKMFKGLAPTKGAAKAFADRLNNIWKVMVTEGETEFIQEWTQALGVSLTQDTPEGKMKAIWEVFTKPENWKNALNSLIGGAIGGGGMRTIGETVSAAIGGDEDTTPKAPEPRIRPENPVKPEVPAPDPVAGVTTGDPATDQAIDEEAAAVADDIIGSDILKAIAAEEDKKREKEEKKKKKEDAVQKPKPAEVDVRQQTADGQTMGEGDAQGQVAPQEGAQVVQEEVAPVVQAPEVAQVPQTELEDFAKTSKEFLEELRGTTKEGEEKKALAKKEKRMLSFPTLNRVKALRNSGLKVFPRTKDDGAVEDFTPFRPQNPFEGANIAQIGKMVQALAKAGYALIGSVEQALVQTKSGQIVINPEMVRDMRENETIDDVIGKYTHNMSEEQALAFEEAVTPAAQKTKSKVAERINEMAMEELSPYLLKKLTEDTAHPRHEAALKEMARRKAGKKRQVEKQAMTQEEEAEIKAQEEKMKAEKEAKKKKAEEAKQEKKEEKAKVKAEKEAKKELKTAEDVVDAVSRRGKDATRSEQQSAEDAKTLAHVEEMIEDGEISEARKIMHKFSISNMGSDEFFPALRKVEKKIKDRLANMGKDESIAVNRKIDRAKYFLAKKMGDSLAAWTAEKQKEYEEKGELSISELRKQYKGTKYFGRIWDASAKVAQDVAQKTFFAAKESPTEKNVKEFNTWAERLVKLYEEADRLFTAEMKINLKETGNVDGIDRFTDYVAGKIAKGTAQEQAKEERARVAREKSTNFTIASRHTTGDNRREESRKMSIKHIMYRMLYNTAEGFRAAMRDGGDTLVNDFNVIMPNEIDPENARGFLTKLKSVAHSMGIDNMESSDFDAQLPYISEFLRALDRFQAITGKTVNIIFVKDLLTIEPDGERKNYIAGFHTHAYEDGSVILVDLNTPNPLTSTLHEITHGLTASILSKYSMTQKVDMTGRRWISEKYKKIGRKAQTYVVPSVKQLMGMGLTEKSAIALNEFYKEANDIVRTTTEYLGSIRQRIDGAMFRYLQNNPNSTLKPKMKEVMQSLHTLGKAFFNNPVNNLRLIEALAEYGDLTVNVSDNKNYGSITMVKVPWPTEMGAKLALAETISETYGNTAWYGMKADQIFDNIEFSMPYYLHNIDEMIASGNSEHGLKNQVSIPDLRIRKPKPANVKASLFRRVRDAVAKAWATIFDIDVTTFEDTIYSAVTRLLDKYDDSIFDGLLTEGEIYARDEFLKGSYAQFVGVRYNYNVQQTGRNNAPKKPRNKVVIALGKYLTKNPKFGETELRAFVDGLNAKLPDDQKITDNEVTTAVARRSKQLEQAEIRRKLKMEANIKRILELSPDQVKQELIDYINKHIKAYGSYNKRNVQDLLDRISGEKDAANYFTYMAEIIQTLSGIHREKLLEQAKAVQRSAKLKRSIPVNEAKLFYDISKMDLDQLTDEELSIFMRLISNVAKTTITQDYKVSPIQNLADLKDFVEKYKAKRAEILNRENVSFQGEDLEVAPAEDESVVASKKAKESRVKGELMKRASFIVWQLGVKVRRDKEGNTYMEVKPGSRMEQILAGRSQTFQDNIKDFVALGQPGFLDVGAMKKYVLSLEYLNKYGELTNFAGQIIVQNKAATRISKRLVGLDGKIKQLRSYGKGEAAFDPRTINQLAEFMSKMVKQVRDQVNQLLFAEAKRKDAYAHNKRRELMHGIQKKAVELKLDKKSLVRIALFSNIFTTKSNPLIEGVEIYREEVQNNVKKYRKALENKIAAAERGKATAFTKEDAVKELAAFEEILLQLKDHGKEGVLTAQEKEFREMLMRVVSELEPEFRQTSIAFAGAKWQHWNEFLPTVAQGSIEGGVTLDHNQDLIEALAKFNPGDTKLPDYESGHARPRNSNAGGVYYNNNIIDVMDHYIGKALFDSQMLSEIMVLNQVLNSQKVRETIGGQNVDIVKGSLRVMVRRSRGEFMFSNKVLRWLESIKNIYVIGKLGTVFQFSIQLLAMIPSIAMMHPKGFIGALRVLANPKSVNFGDPDINNFSDWINKYGHGLQGRQVMFETFKSLEDYSALKEGYQQWTQKAEDVTTYTLRKADAIAASLTFLSSFIESGGDFANPSNEILARAEADTDTLQNTSNPRFASNLFRPTTEGMRAIVSFFFTFKSFAVHQTLNALAALEFSPNSARARKMMLAVAANVALYQTMIIFMGRLKNGMTNWLVDALSDDDEEDEYMEKQEARNKKREQDLLEKIIARSIYDMYFSYVPDILEGQIQGRYDNIRKWIYKKANDTDEGPEPIFFSSQRRGNDTTGLGGYAGLFDLVGDVSEFTEITADKLMGEKIDKEKYALAQMQLMTTAIGLAPFVPFRGDIQSLMRNYLSNRRTEVEKDDALTRGAKAYMSEAEKKRQKQIEKMKKEQREREKEMKKKLE